MKPKTLTMDQREALAAFDAMRANVKAEQYLYADAADPTAFDTEHDLGIMVRTIAERVRYGDVRRVRVIITYDKAES